MEQGHPSFSPKLKVMLGTALADLLGRNRATLHKLIEAYTLPDLPEDSMAIPTEESEAEFYVRMAIGPREVAKLIEAIHEEVTTDNPAVLTKLTPSYYHLMRQLNSEGFTFRGYKLVPIDSEAPQEFKDKTELAARVRSHAELDPKMLIDHMDESDSTIDNEDWKSAAGAARHFFEGLVISISVCTAQLRKGVPPILPEKAQRPKFGKARADLHDISFTTDEEDALIGAMFGFLSEEGGHYGITSPQMAKLSRRFCWVLAAHLLTKYESQSGAAE